MILSSADILRILGGSEIIRLAARIKITDQKPTLTGDDQLLIYISRFPSVAEFEATWTIWLEGDGETDLVAAEIKRLLPKVTVQPGMITKLTTTDFRSEHTQTAPEAAKPQKVQIDTSALDERFQSLQEDIEDRMLLVSSGRNGKDGKDGIAGRDGRDGRDIDATQTELFDLKDVEQSRIPLKPGQVLTWDGEKWTNLYVRQSTTYVGGGGSGSGGGGGNGQINSDTITSDTPPTEREDGKGALRDGDTWWKSDTGAFFVYYADGDSGQWVEIESGEGGGGGIPEAPIDGQQYARQDAAWTVVQATGGGGSTEVSDTPPANPSTGDMWYDLNTARTFVWTGSVWADSNPDVGNVVHVSDTPPDNPGIGNLWYDLNTARTFIWIGSEWVDSNPDAGGGSGGGGGIPEAPADGNYYVRQDNAWVSLADALSALGNRIIDGGDFKKGLSEGDNDLIDGGDFSAS